MSEQAVVKTTDTSESQDVEGKGAQDELDTLLKEYEDGSSETVEQSTQQEDKSTQQETVINPEIQRILDRETQNDIRESTKQIKELSGLALPDKVFRGVLEASVGTDPRARRLWQNRYNDQKGWDAYLNSVAKELVESMKDLPDPSASADRDTVEAAVRSASTHQSTSDDEPDYSAMSDADFAGHKLKLSREARKKK